MCSPAWCEHETPSLTFFVALVRKDHCGTTSTASPGELACFGGAVLNPTGCQAEKIDLKQQARGPEIWVGQWLGLQWLITKKAWRSTYPALWGKGGQRVLSEDNG